VSGFGYQFPYDLKTQILEFIDYFNQTMAKPFKWTYKGKVLAI
jgi:putative transposase